jgi:hypothetical protein
MCQKKLNMNSNVINLYSKIPVPNFVKICSVRPTFCHENRGAFRKYLLEKFFTVQHKGKEEVLVPVHPIKACGKVEVWLQSFLTSTLHGGE